MTDLDRFLVAQHGTDDGVLGELRRGRKTGHWIWFVLPQIAGLGRRATSQLFALASLDESRAYLAHPVLDATVRECAGLVRAIPDRTAVEILGEIDALKQRSSVTIFHRADPDEPVFRWVLDRFHGGDADEATVRMLAG